MKPRPDPTATDAQESALADAWVERLEALGLAVRQALIEAHRRSADLARPVAHEGGDTIYAIDRHVEPLLIEHARQWPQRFGPLMLIAEGLGESGRMHIGPEDAPPRWAVLIDPIDGTRNVMYDKRSAWFIAAAAPMAAGREPRLGDAIASVMVELPTAKMAWSDLFSTTAAGPVRARRRHLVRDEELRLDPAPSAATSLRHGWAQVSNFFPGTKVLASRLMERIVEQTLGPLRAGEALVFDDQYMTTAGQMVELMVGHDRFCCDLRPLFYAAMETAGDDAGAGRGLECHPYDIAGLLVAQRAGVVIADGFGRPLDAPMCVDHPVHWCGYANHTLQRQIEPVIGAFLEECGVRPPS